MQRARDKTDEFARDAALNGQTIESTGICSSLGNGQKPGNRDQAKVATILKWKKKPGKVQ